MVVEFVRWPSEEVRLSALRDLHRPRLVIVADGEAPPLTTDPLEDWVREDTDRADVGHRMRVLGERAQGTGHALPVLDDHGILRRGDRWVSLPPVEHRLMTAMLERYRAVVSRAVLERVGWPDGFGDRNVLDVHMVRLRRRLEPVGLAIRTVRSRGYLLEESVPVAELGS